MTVSRRTALALLLGAPAALVAACSGGTAPAAPASTPPQGPTSTAAAEGAFPVSVDSAFGTATVPAVPTRVATIGITDADPLLALGVQPLSLTGFSFFPQTGLGPWATPLVTGTPVVLDSDTQFSVEQLAALRPDLISALSSGIEQPLYQQLSAIAPVLARPADTPAYTVSRDTITRTLAAALGRPEDGEKLVAAADAALAGARAAHPEFAGRTAVVALPYDGQYGAFLPGDARGRFVTEVGFTVPKAITDLDDGSTFFIPVSLEQLSLLEADVLVVLTDDKTREAVEQDQLLHQLSVVQRGGLVLPDIDLRGAISYNTVLSVPYAVERLVPLLAAALAATTA